MMEVLKVKIKILLLLTILCCVHSQFMAPPMGGMPFPQMPQMQGMPMNAGQMQMSAMPGMPGMGMPMQMPLLPQPKMPVVVMPVNKHKNNDKRKSRSKNRKRRRLRSKKYYDLVSSYSDESSGSSQESDEMIDMSMRGNRRSLKRNYRSSTGKRRQVLTPVISYVTKEGYVVYQKKIKKEKAKDWLNIGKGSNNHEKPDSGEKMSSSEEILRKVLKRGIQKIKNKKIKK